MSLIQVSNNLTHPLVGALGHVGSLLDDHDDGHKEGNSTGSWQLNHTSAEVERALEQFHLAYNQSEHGPYAGRHHGEEEHGEGGGEHGVHGGHADDEVPPVSLAKWQWHHIDTIFVAVLFALGSGAAKLLHHKLHWFAEKVPESVFLIVVGIAFAAIMNEIDRCDPDMKDCSGEIYGLFPDFTAYLFFYALLPPIILEAAWSLHNRVFMGNLRTIVLYAVIGTIINFLLIGAFLILFYDIGAMGSDYVYTRRLVGPPTEVIVEGAPTVFTSMTKVQILLFASLISAVDPVAVLAIFSEVGVNPDLYYNVFGESLLNDGVAVVLYNMMIAFAGMEYKKEEITGGHIVVGIFSFFSIALGGLAIGLIHGFISAVVTKWSKGVETLEVLSVFIFAYLSYITADLVGWSGIISLIGCGLLQAHWSFKNISEKSMATVIYFMKMMGSTADCLIFLYLGMSVMGNQVWHTGFILWSVFLCFVIRIAGTFAQTWLVNWLRKGINPINWQEQVIMSYGGLRGGVGFSLVNMIPLTVVPCAGIFVSTTLAIVMSTCLIQGSTMKSLVKLLKITLATSDKETLNEEINNKLFDHIMGGIESISGKFGHYYIGEWLNVMDNRYLKRWFCAPGYDRKMKKMFQDMTLEDHLTHLYGPTLLIEEKLGEAGYSNQGFNPEGEDLKFNGMKHRMSVSKPITAKDLEEFSQALEKNPLLKYQMFYDRDMSRQSELDLDQVLARRRQSAERIREMVLRKKAKDRSRAQSVAQISLDNEDGGDLMHRGDVHYSSLNYRNQEGRTRLSSASSGGQPSRVFKISKVFEDSKAVDREAVEAVLQEHMSYRRRKSMILDPSKDYEATVKSLKSVSEIMKEGQSPAKDSEGATKKQEEEKDKKSE